MEACSTDALAYALEERDAYTRAHCDRVGQLARRLGQRCELTAAEQAQLQLAAIFHDIGKVGIPDRVLLHPGQLEGSDMLLMQSHSERGERIFARSRHQYASQVARLIRHHHEALDGSGYPDALRGAAIPLAARILRIVDSYDAMVTRRSYRDAMAHDSAMQILHEESGTKIDPEVFVQFERMI